MIFDEFVAVFFVIVVQLGLKDGIGFTTGPHRPLDVPEACRCKEKVRPCARDTCNCRVNKLKCCKYCGCSVSDKCQNKIAEN